MLFAINACTRNGSVRPRSRPSHAPIVLDANQKGSATAVSEANNRFDEITVIQPLTPLAFELDGVAFTGSDPASYPRKQTLRGLHRHRHEPPLSLTLCVRNPRLGQVSHNFASGAHSCTAAGSPRRRLPDGHSHPSSTAKGSDGPNKVARPRIAEIATSQLRAPCIGRLDACCMHLRIRRLQVRVLSSALSLCRSAV